MVWKKTTIALLIGITAFPIVGMEPNDHSPCQKLGDQLEKNENAIKTIHNDLHNSGQHSMDLPHTELRNFEGALKRAASTLKEYRDTLPPAPPGPNLDHMCSMAHEQIAFFFDPKYNDPNFLRLRSYLKGIGFTWE